MALTHVGAPPEPETLVSVDSLEACLPRFLGLDHVTVSSVKISRVGLGTSGAGLWSVEALVDGQDLPVRLILKVSQAGQLTEARFYRDMACGVPLETPRVAEVGFVGKRGWVLLEEIPARSHSTWRENDYLAMVADMAVLHARYWENTAGLTQEWLPEMTPAAMAQQASELRGALDQVAESWLEDGLPEIFGNGRLGQMRSLLADIETVAGPVRDLGMTLVHGDYWFYNCLATESGRRVMVDWQGPMIWSGLWELAYLQNLLLVLGPGGYRESPVSEDLVTSCYRDALYRNGVGVETERFERALRHARILQALAHWLPQIARSSGSKPWEHGAKWDGVRWFFQTTFERWSEDVSRL